MVDIFKICKNCKLQKSIIEFCKDSKQKDKLARWCKSCLYKNNKESYYRNIIKTKNTHRKWREANKDYIKSKRLEVRIANPEYNAYESAKHRAKKYNIPFDIELEDIIVPEYCPILGIKLERGEGKATSNSPNMDKIIPELGYIKGNIQIISNLANVMKSNTTFEELIKFSEWIEENIRPILNNK